MLANTSGRFTRGSFRTGVADVGITVELPRLVVHQNQPYCHNLLPVNI